MVAQIGTRNEDAETDGKTVSVEVVEAVEAVLSVLAQSPSH